MSVLNTRLLTDRNSKESSHLYISMFGSHVSKYNNIFVDMKYAIMYLHITNLKQDRRAYFAEINKHMTETERKMGKRIKEEALKI